MFIYNNVRVYVHVHVLAQPNRNNTSASMF